MLRKLLWSLLIAIFIIASACSTSSKPNGSEVEIETSSAELLPSEVMTATPEPTATPTPLPVTRIDNGAYYIFSGELEKARLEFEEVKNNATDENLIASANIYLARIKIANNLCKNAIPILESVVNSDSIKNNLRSNASYFLGQCFLEMNQFGKAALAYQNYIDLNPGILDAFMYELAGDAYVKAGDINNAILMYAAVAGDSTADNQVSAKIKLGQMYVLEADYTNAVRIFMEVHDTSSNDYTRAQMNFLAGQSYLMLGLPEQAYARFQESVENYPKSYDTYSGLVTLVNEGIKVDEFYRGLVDYYAQKYGLAIDAFNRYLNANPQHNGSAHYFKALAYQAIDQPLEAIQEWRVLIKDHPADRFYVDAWEDIAYTQWAYLDDYRAGAQTLISFVKENPSSESAPQALFDAGRIYERGGYLSEAAATWSGMIDQYPQAEISSRGLYLSGITLYRLNNFPQALESFQRILLFGGNPTITAAANLWIGKTYKGLGDLENANTSWRQASEADPTGYYSERAKQLMEDQAPYSIPASVNFAINFDQERFIAEIWMQKTFSLPADTNFITLAELKENNTFVQAVALWDLGLYQVARTKFESVRDTFSQDPINLFRLTNYFREIGLYRSAIYGSRQILELANMSDLDTLNAPLWFNHVRFGDYYQEIVAENAARYNLDPLLLLSLMRQESFFEGFVASSAGARGVMQIMPVTGDEIFGYLGWPENYSAEDLYIPAVNIRYGASYLSRMRDYFKGDIFAALAAYNAGPGNVLKWENQASNDPDLFLEMIPYEETRRYITNIFEFYQLYITFYRTNE
ncbi:MAG: hypothetical protein BGO78_04650 [Chloroflexi bacterium 44-23]|nr:MAG: hypothetical protein BGO78_04650 [Chloroflexi bacterium 44-23]